MAFGDVVVDIVNVAGNTNTDAEPPMGWGARHLILLAHAPGSTEGQEYFRA